MSFDIKIVEIEGLRTIEVQVIEGVAINTKGRLLIKKIMVELARIFE